MFSLLDSLWACSDKIRADPYTLTQERKENKNLDRVLTMTTNNQLTI